MSSLALLEAASQVLSEGAQLHAAEQRRSFVMAFIVLQELQTLGAGAQNIWLEHAGVLVCLVLGSSAASQCCCFDRLSCVRRNERNFALADFGKRATAVQESLSSGDSEFCGSSVQKYDCEQGKVFADQQSPMYQDQYPYQLVPQLCTCGICLRLSNIYHRMSLDQKAVDIKYKILNLQIR